jgi:hypothetical protein
MSKLRANSGDFDPVSAYVYAPNRTQLGSGEHKSGEPLLILVSRIKPLRPFFVREQMNQGHAMSTSDLRMEIRVEGGGDQLTSDMWVIHRDKRYNIKGFSGSDPQVGTAVYQVTRVNDYTGVSESDRPC